MKLTTQQIALIDNELLKARMGYYDIRLELTDHVAAELEQLDGNFENYLAAYMAQNKKQLRRLNFRFMKIGAAKGMKLLFANMLSWEALLSFAGIIALGKVIEQFAAAEDMGSFMFLIFCVCSCIGSFPSVVINVIRKRENYSFNGGVAFLPLLILYPSIFMQNVLQNPNALILYYAVMGAFSINIHFTVKRLYRQYRSVYSV